GHVRDFVAGHGDASPRGNVESAEQVQQCGLAGSAGPHEGDEIALVNVEIQPLQYVDFFAPTAICLVQPAHLNLTVRFSSAVQLNHVCAPLLFPGLYFLIWTLSPSWRLGGPFTTTVSPTTKPAMTSTSVPRFPPSVTARRSVL